MAASPDSTPHCSSFFRAMAGEASLTSSIRCQSVTSRRSMCLACASLSFCSAPARAVFTRVVFFPASLICASIAAASSRRFLSAMHS